MIVSQGTLSIVSEGTIPNQIKNQSGGSPHVNLANVVSDLETLQRGSGINISAEHLMSQCLDSIEAA